MLIIVEVIDIIFACVDSLFGFILEIHLFEKKQNKQAFYFGGKNRIPNS